MPFADDHPGRHQAPARVPATGPEPAAPFSLEDDLRVYREMLLIRRFEERAGQLFAMGDIGGYCHLGIGREAVPVGLAMAAGEGDPLLAPSRHHGDLLARGVPPGALMAELAGRSDGCCGGRAGSLHVCAPSVGVYGGLGLDAPTAVMAAGMALAARYRAQPLVVWCHVSEARSASGDVFEALQAAVRLELPLVLVIEAYAAQAGGAAPDVSQLGRGLGVPGWQVDATDVRAVRDAAMRAGARARAGGGPFILQMTTPRFRGHAMADPIEIGCRDTAALRALSDPIAHVKLRLIEAGEPEQSLRRVDDEVRSLVEAAADFALASPAPVLHAVHA